jgi:hypothetical protein
VSAPSSSRIGIRAGWTLSAIVLLFLAMDAGMKLAGAQPVLDTARQMGWPADVETARLLGLLLAFGGVLYAWPRTAMLGAIWLTGYLGGAIASHVRIASPLFSHVLFGGYLALMLWGGLWLRDPRLRTLLPLARPNSQEN